MHCCTALMTFGRTWPGNAKLCTAALMTFGFDMAISKNLDVAAKAASYNVLLQILLRASTFILNGFILRFVQAELLGVVNLR